MFQDLFQSAIRDVRMLFLPDKEAISHIRTMQVRVVVFKITLYLKRCAFFPDACVQNQDQQAPCFSLFGDNIKNCLKVFPKSQESQPVIMWGCVAKGT